MCVGPGFDSLPLTRVIRFSPFLITPLKFSWRDALRKGLNLLDPDRHEMVDLILGGRLPILARSSKDFQCGSPEAPAFRWFLSISFVQIVRIALDQYSYVKYDIFSLRGYP